MSDSRSQSDSSPHDTPNLPEPGASRQQTTCPPSGARDNGRGHSRLPTHADLRSDNGRRSGAPIRCIEDHPGWSAYLSQRRILEPAIAAGAWIEHEEWTGQAVLVWWTRRRDGSPGATRRRLLKRVKVKGKKQTKLRWQYAGKKTDEPFYYVGTLDDLKREIARAGGKVYIVEGEFDVWSLHRLGILNVIGIYGISNIPRDIGAILDEIGVSSFVYLADNDTAGAKGASNLCALLHGSSWAGEGEYRQVAGAGIPEKGDANDLLCHHFPDLPAARAALEALPRFQPRLKRKKAATPAVAPDESGEGWQAVKEAIRIELGVERFKPNGFSPNFSCRIPGHEDDDEPSAGWHRDGYYKCFKCHGPDEFLNAKDTAELLRIDWRALLKSQPQLVSSKDLDLDAAPQGAARAPLAFDQTPDSWLKLPTKFYKPTEATLLHYALRCCRSGPLAAGFTRDEFVAAARPLGCNLKEDTIKKFFKKEVFEADNHAIFAKVDPSARSKIRTCKFRLRPLEDIRCRLMQGIRYRVYEETFRRHDDVLIEFKAFDEVLQGSEYAKKLQSALEPLYTEQKQRFASLKHVCERKIAAYEAELDDLSATPLPDWTIDQPCDLPAVFARGIYNADPEDRSMREWVRLLGISRSNVDAVLQRAGIERRAYTVKEEVDSQREAKARARELGAKIIAVEVDGGHESYDAAMDIPENSTVFLQPTARHEVVSDEKQTIKTPAKSPSRPARQIAPARAHNMEAPGNWTKASWDPQFIYWELVKACCLLHGYEALVGIGIVNPETGEVWTNPTRDELLGLITGESAPAEPDPG